MPNLTKKEIKKKVDEGYIHANVIFEIIGKPKEHVEETLKLYMEQLDNAENVITLSKDYEETIAVDSDVYSTAVEVEYLIYGMEKLTWLAFNFMPASIEIKAPKELTFKDKDLTTWLNDLMARLHEVSTVQATLKGHNDELMKSLNISIRNTILLMAKEPISAKVVAEHIGMKEDHAEKFLAAMVKEGRLEKKGAKFVKK